MSARTVSLPSYSVAVTRIPLTTSTGVYRKGRRQGESILVQGKVTLNVVDRRLNSVTVTPVVGKSVNIKVDRLSPLALTAATSKADALVFASFTR